MKAFKKIRNEFADQQKPAVSDEFIEFVNQVLSIK